MFLPRRAGWNHASLKHLMGGTRPPFQISVSALHDSIAFLSASAQFSYTFTVRRDSEDRFETFTFRQFGRSRIYSIEKKRYSLCTFQRFTLPDFGAWDRSSSLTLKLRRGLNILVGPNDSGKTAVIDAPRFVLWTRGDDFLRLEPSDFHVKPNGERVTELFIRCTFDDLTPDEEGSFSRMVQ